MTRTSPLRLLLVVPSLRRAGAETQALDLANGLDPQAFRKTLFTFEADLAQIEKLDRAQVEFVNHPRRFKFDPSIVTALARVIDSAEIDVVHCTMQFSLLVAWLALRRTRRRPRLVAAIHTTKNRSRKEEIQDRRVYRRLLRRCDRIIYVSRNQADYWGARFPELRPHAVVVHNGVDTRLFHAPDFTDAGQQLRRELGIAKSAPALACIAGLRPEKGHRILLEALKRAPRDTHLLLAGDGPERPLLESVARASGLESNIHFLGNVRDVRPVLAAVDTTILASTAVETFSMAMLESMAMGRPVIGSRLGGMDEAVKHGETGLLVPSGDPDALAAAIRTVVHDPAARTAMGVHSRRLVVREFTREKMLESTRRVLQATLAG